MTLTAQITAKLPEKDFQQQVVDLATAYGWRHFHVFDSRRSDAGFPDLVLVRGPELLFVELKTQTGTISAAQRDWLRDLSKVQNGLEARFAGGPVPLPGVPPACVEVFVWRPSDFDEINHRLSRRTAAASTGSAS